MLLTLRQSKPSVNCEQNNRNSCETQNSFELCAQLVGIEEDGRHSRQRSEREAERVATLPTLPTYQALPKPSHLCVDVMVVPVVRQPVPEPKPEPRHLRYYKQHLCVILWRVLVFVMLPRYCLSLAGKSLFDSFAITFYYCIIITI